MVKQVIVTFEYDSESDSVKNVKCSVDGVEKKKTSTKKKEEVEKVIESQAIITLEETKLVLNNKAVLDLGAEYNSRILIRFEQNGKTKTVFPVISVDEEKGNKLTKSNTVAYKGKQNEVLAEFGTSFTLAPFKEGIFKLVSQDTKEDIEDMIEDIEDASEIEPMVIIDDEENIDLDDLTYKL